MRTLIVGAGQIGKSLGLVLREYNPSFHDPLIGQVASGTFDILHICFGYTPNFITQVKGYQDQFKPKYTVIHSTVPMGACRELDAIHHPVTGLHPHLEVSMLAATQFLSGPKASQVANYFRRAGMKIYLFDKQETTELGKISQTTFYALMIEYVKDLKRRCDAFGLSFTEVYTLMSQEYNNLYEKLNLSEYCMPLLTPIMTPQGGHCTIPNLELWQTPFTELIKKQNQI